MADDRTLELAEERNERPKGQPTRVHWIGEHYPINAVHGVDTWNGQLIPATAKP